MKLEDVKSMWFGCHICGTGNMTYTYIHRDLFGYYPCYDCWQEYIKKTDYHWDISRLFFSMMDDAGYANSYEKYEEYEFIRADLGRRFLRRIRNDNGIIEPPAICSKCRRIKPLFDMARRDAPLRLSNGIIHAGFVCFECYYHEHLPTAIYCVICKSHKRHLDNRFVRNICLSCGAIIDHDEKIQEKRYAQYEESLKWRFLDVSDIYCRYLLKRSGIVDPTLGEIGFKREQIVYRRLLKKLKKWRAEHESDSDVISGEQREDEAVDEVYRGREETGHGGSSGLSTGM